MAEKKIVPYKSQFIYNTSDGSAIQVKIDFEPLAAMPRLILELSERVSETDLNIIMESVSKSLNYRMGFNIFEYNGGNIDITVNQPENNPA